MKIACIGCVKEKLSVVAPAEKIYVGQQFLDWRQEAIAWGADEFYILSGKHGLLNPKEIIAPYDVNLDQQSTEYKNEWFKRVAKRLNSLIEANKNVELKFFCAQSYSDGIIPLLKKGI